jgi:uncharacterized membrane protein
MASILEQMQELLHSLENRIKSQERRITNLEQLVSKQHSTYGLQSHAQSAKAKIASRKHGTMQRFELNIGTYLLQSTGIVLFVLGMGFLLKYSIEQGWMQPMTRIIIGLAIATLALGIGEYLRTRYQQWALALSAGGIVLYYLSFYAGFAFYHVISMGIAFICFCIIMLGALALALWHNSLFIALFSLIGGFLIPFILGVQVLHPSILMGYLLLLSLGYLGLSYYKKWFSLSYVSLAFIIWYVWIQMMPFSLNQDLIFQAALWIIYVCIPFMYCLFSHQRQRLFESIVILTGSLFIFFYTYTILIRYDFVNVSWMISWFFTGLVPAMVFNHLAFFFAVIYFILLGALFTYSRKNTFLLTTLYAITIGSIIGFIATQFDGYSCSAALAILGLLLFALSFIFKLWPMRIASYLIWIASSSYLLFLGLLYAGKVESIFFNEITISLVLVFLSFGISAWLSERYNALLAQHERHVPHALESATALVLVYFVHTKVWRFPYHIIGLILYSLVLLWVSLYRNKKFLRQLSYGVCFLAIIYFSWNYYLKNLVNPYWTLKLNLLFLTFAIVFISASLLIRRFRSILSEREFNGAKTVFDLLVALCIFVWIRANIILQGDALRHQGGSVIAQRLMGYSIKHDILIRKGITNVFLVLFYTIYSVILIAFGLFGRNRTMRYLGLTIIVFALKLLIELTWQLPHTMQRIIAFVCVGVLLVGASFLYQKMSKKTE